ncbi:MAG: AEC family transporter [Actinomycetota bacterium]
MSFLGLLIDVLGPVVLVVAAGAIIGPRLRLDIGTLSRVAFWVLGPCFVFDLFVTTELAGGTAARLAIAGLAGMAAAIIAVALVGPPVGIRRSRLRASMMTGAYGNVGNAGLAIVVFAMGESARASAGVLMLTISVTGIALGVGLASAGSASLLTALRRALLAPMPVAAMVAMAVNAVNVEVPLVAGRAAGLLADAMIPLMLFTLGLQLVEAGGVRLSVPVMVSAGAKLVVAPIAAAAVAIALGLRGDDLAAVVLQSAMPPAVFCVLVALEFDLERTLVTESVVVTTVLSLLTLPVALALVT